MKDLPKTVYDFLDEILGSIVPGIYFCSYILFCAVFWLTPKTFTNLNIEKYLLIVPLLAISYVIGTAFRRAHLGKVDLESARYIYFHSLPKDDNSFAFASMISDDDYTKIIEQTKRKDLDVNEEQKETDKKYNILMMLCGLHIPHVILFLKRRKRFFGKKLYSKTAVLKYIYRKTRNKYRIFRFYEYLNENVEFPKYIQEFKDFHLEIRDRVMVSAVYPYSHLKEYLCDRGFSELAKKYVTWECTDDNQITNRSKSIICQYKVEIYNKVPEKMMYMLKCEAHIRFMTAMWYANRILNPTSFFIGVISFLILMVETVFRLYNDSVNLSNMIGNKIIEFFYSIGFNLLDVADLNKAIKIFANYINQLAATHNLIDIMLLSIIFFSISRYINHIIKKTFHYQRVREIVYILQTHEECI